MTRRAALLAGGLGFWGWAQPHLLQALEVQSRGSAKAAPRLGKARACILIFQWGGPSQLETWDLKPEAPESIRGSFKPIATTVPGIQISEHFPRLAQQAHRLAIIRSMTHTDPAHLSSAHRVVTGHLAPRVNSDADGPSPNDWPHLGSLIAKVRPVQGALPTSVSMPWSVAHPAAPGGRAPGQHGGWLGSLYDPFVVDSDPNQKAFRVDGLGLPEGVTPSRMEERRDLLQSLRGEAPPAESWVRHQERALDALASAQARGAFRVDQEEARTRDRYGRHIHGQCLLLARRLVEAGVTLVTVNWHDDHQNFWDTHGENFHHLKNRLMPPADQGFAALLDDLAERGLLEETLIVWTGEFGRNPRINPANNGREHWPRCYSSVLAGGGIKGGVTHGASDHWAAYPARDPVSPDDIGATILHALGIDPSQEIPDPIGRPMRINQGQPLASLFG